MSIFFVCSAKLPMPNACDPCETRRVYDMLYTNSGHFCSVCFFFFCQHLELPQLVVVGHVLLFVPSLARVYSILMLTHCCCHFCSCFCCFSCFFAVLLVWLSSLYIFQNLIDYFSLCYNEIYLCFCCWKIRK